MNHSLGHSVHLTWSMIATGFLAYCMTCGALSVFLARSLAASLHGAFPTEVLGAVVMVGVGLATGLLLGRPKILNAIADSVCD